MLVVVSLAHVELDVVLQEQLVAATASFVYGRCGIVVTVANKEILIVATNHHRDGILISISHSRTDETVVSEPCRCLGLKGVEIGLYDNPRRIALHRLGSALDGGLKDRGNEMPS